MFKNNILDLEVFRRVGRQCHTMVAIFSIRKILKVVGNGLEGNRVLISRVLTYELKEMLKAV